MFRFRDHVISLVAVFLALGLGILIGTGMSDDMLVTQQRLLIEQMSRDQRSLREEAQAMEAEVQSLTRDIYLWEKYQEALYPGVVGGFLTDKPMSVIYHGTEFPDDVLNVLRDAEAEICSVIGIEKKEQLALGDGDIGTILGKYVTGETLDAESQTQMSSYQADERISVQRYSRNAPQGIIVVLGERDDVEQAVVHDIISVLDQDQLTLVGLEYSKIKDSVLHDLKEVGISTIDNGDTVFGQFSLLAVLRGSAGNYGIKSAADQFIANY